MRVRYENVGWLKTSQANLRDGVWHPKGSGEDTEQRCPLYATMCRLWS
jgi:hypothetical protein